MFLALHYKHTGDIVQRQGRIAFRWWSNIQVGEIPKDLATVTNQFPTLERATSPLDDQFYYRFGVSDTDRMSVFLVFFRESFSMLGFVCGDNNIDFVDEEDLLRPFSPAAA